MSDTASENNTRFTLPARVGSYPVVEYSIDTVKSVYNYTKESNFIIKAGLQKAEGYSSPIITRLETYTHQPTIEKTLQHLDSFGCARLDQVEAVKPKTIEAAENIANKIHGTRMEAILIKTVGAVDVVVDTLLPAPSSSDETNKDDKEGDKKESKEENIIDKSAPIIKKIVERSSKESIKNIPYRTYKTADEVPQIHYAIGVVSSAVHKVLWVQDGAKNHLEKRAKASKEQILQVYTALAGLTSALAFFQFRNSIKISGGAEQDD